MITWKRICVAVDFSEPSRRALRVAAELAAKLDAVLTVVHVHDVPSVAGTDVPAVPPSPRSATARAEATRLLADARADAEAIAPGRVTSELLEGDPAWEVVKLAADRGDDVIVVGTHGRTGVRRLMVGSVAERVVREATVPVLAVREPGAPDADR
jgi:nucleotide-binding universal stress UspA family protein